MYGQMSLSPVSIPIQQFNLCVLYYKLTWNFPLCKGQGQVGCIQPAVDRICGWLLLQDTGSRTCSKCRSKGHSDQKCDRLLHLQSSYWIPGLHLLLNVHSCFQGYHLQLQWTSKIAPKDILYILILTIIYKKASLTFCVSYEECEMRIEI